MENFINEFKTYCETVEDATGLEVIKDNLFGDVLNLETFIDDNVEIKLYEAKKEDILKEANRLIKALKVSTETANNINNTDVRYIYSLLPKDNENLKELFSWVMHDCYEKVYEKVYPNENSLLFKCKLKESDFPKWYIDLCNLLDKYGM